MHSKATDVGSLSTGELVDAAAALASELAHRMASGAASDSPSAVCMEWAETLVRAADVHESTLSRLIEVVDRAGEVRRWGLPSAQA